MAAIILLPLFMAALFNGLLCLATTVTRVPYLR
jgi:hypothetical protein